MDELRIHRPRRSSLLAILPNWQHNHFPTIMATRISNCRSLASAFRSTRTSLACRNSTGIRGFASSQHVQVVVSSDQPNMRHAQREPDRELRGPPINPADKYAAKADDLHRYGSWLMGCLPKYIQQFSVWKDELVIYIPPSGVIPVFSFLKCMPHVKPPLHFSRLILHRQHICRIHAGLGHYCCRFPHSRPTI